MAGGSDTGAGPRQNPVVGIVGAGQLARMLCEAASALGVATVVLAERADDSATAVAGEVLLGGPRDPAALAALAGRADVVTFDHELVDLDVLRAHAADPSAVPLRPGPGTLEVAVDKTAMRRRLGAAGLPAPSWAAVGSPADLARFTQDHGWPVVLKAARGGYDGRGVWPLDDPGSAAPLVDELLAAGTPLLVEERVAMDAELAVLVARRPGGELVTWPAVETAQVGGVCREVLVPGRLPPGVVSSAADVGAAVAAELGSVGVLAVELFLVGDRLLVNEVASRPHNSGHWTIEGAVTSQFENHLRAVLDLPLGDTAVTAPAVASVNVFGGPRGDDLAAALAVPGAHVHRYGKGHRPGRKLGHVTVTGDEAAAVRAAAWAAARALGTPVPEGLAVPA